MVPSLDATTIEANRAHLRDELMDAGMAASGADAWCAAWDAEAQRLGIDHRVGDYWILGSAWIHEQWAKRQESAGGGCLEASTRLDR